VSELVLLTVDEGVATLSFNRPQVFNAMDAEMMIQFRAAAEQVQRDSTVRAVVLRGEGKAFLAGGDVAHEDFKPAGRVCYWSWPP
jgi:2-(1,2-epoxy-1,2-dihydrophenyl)acetyl-CoA isomerase